MPKIIVYLLLSFCLSISLVGKENSKRPYKDQLVPVSIVNKSKVEEEVKSILDSFIEQKIEQKTNYTVKTVKERHGGWLSPIGMYRYKVSNLTEDLANSLKRLRDICPNNLFNKYIFDKKYSFYFALAYLNSSYGPPPGRIAPLIEKDKNAWDKNIKKYGNLFIKHYKITNNYSEHFILFTEAIPGNDYSPEMDAVRQGKYAVELISTNSMGYWINGYKGIRKRNSYDKSNEELYPVADMVANAIEEYNSKGDSKYFAKIDTGKYGFRPWLYFIFNASEKDVPYNIKPFIAYLRAQRERKPLYSAIVMSLFIVFGYEFDEKTGNYIPNEIGKTMLDYIVENPIHENAERLQIIKNGGNEKLITGLMERHKMKEKWAELWSEERQ